ncbi:MAG: hypothetical protein CMD06_05710 [Flavobacteriales bacterium]|nr:hypothetical protein [Flavobacteriales bacterium]
MKKNILNITNKYRAIIVTVLISCFGLFFLILPVILNSLISDSLIGSFISNNFYNIILIIFPILIYFIFIGVYYFEINVDPYVIQITSFRTISSILFKKNYIDISNSMLKEFRFFNRPFSFNQTLMIKLENQNGKIIAKRFNISFVTQKEKMNITSSLNIILKINNERRSR